MSPPNLKHVQLYPTLRCNRRCSFCFNRSLSPSVHGLPDMSREAGLRLLDILGGRGIEEIDVLGGEPLLLDWLPDFALAAVGMGIRVNISTNGSLPESLLAFREFKPAEVTIGVSIDGSTEKGQDSLSDSANFASASASLQLLVGLGLEPVAKTVVNRQTMRHIPNIAAFLSAAGVKRYYLIHMDVMSGDAGIISRGLSYPEFLRFYESMRLRHPAPAVFKVHASCFEAASLPPGARCAGGVRKLAVLPDGSVYPCNLLMHFDSYALGNIFRDPFSEIWRSPRLAFFRSVSSNWCPVTGCSRRGVCAGGCPAHSLFHFGDPDAPDIRCM